MTGPVEALLRAAGERITDPGRVCTGAFARNSNGDVCSTTEPDACQWCAAGAVLAVSPTEEPRTMAWDMLKSVAMGFGYKDAINANDLTDGRIIGDLYSEAIEAAAELGL